MLPANLQPTTTITKVINIGGPPAAPTANDTTSTSNIAPTASGTSTITVSKVAEVAGDSSERVAKIKEEPPDEILPEDKSSFKVLLNVSVRYICLNFPFVEQVPPNPPLPLPSFSGLNGHPVPLPPDGVKATSAFMPKLELSVKALKSGGWSCTIDFN